MYLEVTVIPRVRSPLVRSQGMRFLAPDGARYRALRDAGGRGSVIRNQASIVVLFGTAQVRLRRELWKRTCCLLVLTLTSRGP